MIFSPDSPAVRPDLRNRSQKTRTSQCTGWRGFRKDATTTAKEHSERGEIRRPRCVVLVVGGISVFIQPPVGAAGVELACGGAAALAFATKQSQRQILNSSRVLTKVENVVKVSRSVSSV